MENLLNHCIFASYLVKKILLKIIHLYFLTKEIIKGALMPCTTLLLSTRWKIKRTSDELRNHISFILNLFWKYLIWFPWKCCFRYVSYYYMGKRNIVLSQPDNKWLFITYFIFWLIRRGTAVYNLDFGMPG